MNVFLVFLSAGVCAAGKMCFNAICLLLLEFSFLKAIDETTTLKPERELELIGSLNPLLEKKN